MTTTAKSTRQLYQTHLDVFADTRKNREQINADSERWKAEKLQGMKTPPFQNQKRLEALSTLDFKIGLCPFALAREDERDAEALSALNTLYASLLNEGSTMLERVTAESWETFQATAGIDSEEEMLPYATDALFRCSEIGRRLIEANIERPGGPLHSFGEALRVAIWYDQAARILTDWEARKLRAERVPTSAA